MRGRVRVWQALIRGLAFDRWDVGKVAKDKAKKIEARSGVVPTKGLHSFAEELEQGRALHHLSLSLLPARFRAG